MPLQKVNKKYSKMFNIEIPKGKLAKYATKIKHPIGRIGWKLWENNAFSVIFGESSGSVGILNTESESDNTNNAQRATQHELRELENLEGETAT